MNRPIKSNEIESVIKNKKTTNKSVGQDGFTVEFYQMFREELTPILPEIFQKITEEKMLPNSLYKATIILILKPEKNITNKEIYRSTFMMNTYAKILNKILANRIQQHVKRIIHHDRV